MLKRDTCYECGRRETWRSAWRMRRWLKKHPPVPLDPPYFADWVSDAVLREMRPRLRPRLWSR